MKSFIACLMLTCLVAGVAFAESPANPLAPGARAIQFQIGDNFEVKAFDGMSVSFKRHSSAEAAWRLGVMLDFTIDDLDAETGFVEQDDVLVSSNDIDSNGQSLRVDLLRLRYPSPGKDVCWYWGVGPRARFSRFEEEAMSVHGVQPGTETQLTREESHTWSVGALGVGGVEWFVADGVSLHAEYAASLEYGAATRESESWRGEDGEPPTTHGASNNASHGWDFGGTQAIFGASLYF
jgi:opacity protein-like surface antigen